MKQPLQINDRDIPQSDVIELIAEAMNNLTKRVKREIPHEDKEHSSRI